MNWPQGIKKTQPRMAVWTTLHKIDHPVTAQTIAEQLRSRQIRAWMSTIYRTLDFFEAKGLVRKTVIGNDSTAMYELATAPHRHYAICTHCHTLFPLKQCPVIHDEELVGQNFHIEGHTLAIYGTCESCQKSHK